MYVTVVLKLQYRYIDWDIHQYVCIPYNTYIVLHTFGNHHVKASIRLLPACARAAPTPTKERARAPATTKRMSGRLEKGLILTGVWKSTPKQGSPPVVARFHIGIAELKQPIRNRPPLRCSGTLILCSTHCTNITCIYLHGTASDTYSTSFVTV